MGNLGLGEMLVIVLIALLVFGPNKLPEIMRSIGKAWRTFQDETQKATSVLRESFDEVSITDETPTAPGIVDRADGSPNAAPPPAAPADGKTEALPRALRKYEDT